MDFKTPKSCFNSIHGTISNAIENLTSLSSLDLSNNKLSGRIPRENTKLCRIRDLSLSFNELQGEISDSFGDMSECFLGSLESLHLRSNNLSGHLTSQFGEFKNLRFLVLGNNSLSGAIPVSIGKLSSLKQLYIEDNKLDGVVTESHFTNLTKLVTLSASKNHLILNVSSDWSPSFQLKTLKLRSWNMGVGSKFPSWLKNQKYIRYLDLYGTGITGKIPEQVHSKFLYLSSIKFSGSVLRITCDMRDLDLSNNSFSGDCWLKFPELGYLNIGNNNISGGIPNSIQFLAWLSSLNLGGNKISGQLPLSMRNCMKLVKIDLADNDLDGSIPTWMGTSLFHLQILILRSNKLSNEIPLEICNLNSLQILDLADNRFSGRIPRGAIPDSIGNMKQLESLDFSRNSLSGQIPNGFTLLSSLAYLNLSCNNLTGKIPESTQLLGFNATSFTANNLCGPPLTSHCRGDGDEVHEHEDEKEGDESKIEWLYVVLSLGYAVGFSVVCSALVLKKSWRDAYFGLLDSMWDKLYVYVYIRWRRLTATPSGARS
ncbi:hypothetical protein ACS0TY_011428 [Phlomoides rotata]